MNDMKAGSPIGNKMNDTKTGSTFANKMMMLFLLAIGYEWLASGITKIASGTFVSGLHDEMFGAIKDGGPYSFYAGFLKSVCLPHCTMLGYFIEIGELLTGAAFILIAIMFLIKGSFIKWTAPVGIISSVLSLMLIINIFLFTGSKFFFSTEEPFDETISLDWLMILFSMILVVYFVGVTRMKKLSHK